MNSLNKIAAAVAAIEGDKIVAPTDKVQEGEIVLGTVNDTELHKLFIVRQGLREGIVTKVQDLRKKDGEEHVEEGDVCPLCEALRATMMEIQSAIEFESIVDGIVNHEVRLSLAADAIQKLGPHDTIAIREGWQIVKVEGGPRLVGLEIVQMLGGLGDMISALRRMRM